MHRLSQGLMMALAALAIPQAAGAYEGLPRSLAQLEPADFAKKISFAEDPQQGAVVISTRDGYARGRPIRGAHANDVHLRARVDRDTGKVTWQVWHDIMYTGGQKDLHAVHFLSGGTLEQARPLVVEHWLDQCPPTDGVGFCNRNTRIAFELPERTVREIAASYRAGVREPWRLHFKDTHGRDVIGGLAPAEAAGLIQALDAWKSAAG